MEGAAGGGTTSVRWGSSGQAGHSEGHHRWLCPRAEEQRRSSLGARSSHSVVSKCCHSPGHGDSSCLRGSYFCFLLKKHRKGIVCQSVLDVGADL